MNMVLMLLGGLLAVGAFVAGIIILIDAFKNEVWKGLLSLFCGIYMLVYAFTEFDHEKKGLILALWLLGGIGGYALMMAAGAMTPQTTGMGAGIP